jgi:hypothetical protein
LTDGSRINEVKGIGLDLDREFLIVCFDLVYLPGAAPLLEKPALQMRMPEE